MQAWVGMFQQIKKKKKKDIIILNMKILNMEILYKMASNYTENSGQVQIITEHEYEEYDSHQIK